AVAGHVVEGALAAFARGGLALVAARLATLGLVGEALASVELLIIRREKERTSAVDASEVLVRVLLHHGISRSPGFYPLAGRLSARAKKMVNRMHTVETPAPRAPDQSSL